jgi:flagellar biosynthetic protein FliR
MQLASYVDGFWSWLLVFARTTGLIFTMPVLSAEGVPYRVRAILSLFTSAVLYPVVRNYLPAASFDAMPIYILEMVSQAFTGIIIGFLLQIVFAAFTLAGEFFSIQMGVSFSEVLDPQAQVSVPILGTLKNMIAILLFLSVDFELDGYYVPAYLHVFRALSYSFQQAPTLVLNIQTMGGLLAYVDQAFGVMFLTALRIGLPLAGILFITSVALGVAGKAAPQLNLMNMGLQINIMVGLVILALLVPVILPLMRDSFQHMFDVLAEMLKAWPEAPV